jgi:ubiquinone/menaquinone biosynthesis C-methylase UbiE
MFLPLRRRDNPHAFFVGMIGVRMGDSVAQVGCAHAGRLAAIAGKVGLSGRIVLVAPYAASSERARKGAQDAGVLVDIETARATDLPLEDNSFDVVVIDDTDGLLSTADSENRAATVREAFRILKPGGRALVVAAGTPAGLGAWLPGSRQVPSLDATPWLEAGAFKGVRRLAEREGLIFTEGLKPRA